MHTDKEIPVVEESTLLNEALIEMSRKGLGATVIANQRNQVLGIFTDGDIRRVLDANVDIKTAIVEEHMTAGCKTIGVDSLAVEALKMMNDYKINCPACYR